MTYSPGPAPKGPPEFADFYRYVESELAAISQTLKDTDALDLRTTSKEPKRPRDGMIVDADGTSWDPGAGAGTYKYQNGLWVKFGDAAHTHVMADVTDAGDLATLDTVTTSLISGITSKRIIGRDSASTGAAEQLTLTQVLDFIGSAARGDILTRGASAWQRLAKGSADQFLKSDGTDPLWSALPASTSWNAMQTNSPTSGTTSDFTSIPQTSKCLLFIGDRMDYSSGSGEVSIYVGTTSSFGTLVTQNYSFLQVTGTSVGGNSETSNDHSYLGGADTTSTTFFAVLIFDYTGSKYKQGIAFSQRQNSGGNFQVTHFVIETTSAIQHVRFGSGGGNYVGGTISMVGLFT